MLTVIRKEMRSFWRNEEGLGMLELILIIAVIVIIAMLFRDQLKSIVESLLGKAKTKTEKFMDET